MSLGEKLKRTANRGADWIVGIMSGTVPVRGLEGSNAYRVTVGLVIVGLGLGSWLIWHNIHSLGVPIAPVPNSNTSAVAELDKLRTKDTDGDGLSDYDELFSSKTSPYLSDSDSDGVSDNQEVIKGTNPNCPTGQSCSAPTQVAAGSDTSLSAGFLRQALKASGVAQSTLDALSDEDIVRIYGDVSNQAATSNTNVAGLSIDQLSALSAADIRSLLQAAGVDDATLGQVDDATLKEIFKQAITSESP